MGNPYDDYVSLLLIYVMYYTMKSVCVIAVILPKNQKTSNNMSEKNITFEDLPKAMSWLMDKLNELDSKIDGLNNQNQSVPTEQWMNLKELCDYIPSHPAEQTVYGWTSCHLIPFHKRGKRIMFLKSEIDEWLHAGKIKSDKNLEDEAAQFIKSKKKYQILMDSTNLCNALRMEFEGIFENKIPLDAFPAKIQDMIFGSIPTRELFHRIYDGFSFGSSVNRYR